MMRAWILIAGIACSGLMAAAQTAAAPAAGSYTISGIVRSAANGAPLDRARVTLATAGTQQSEVAAVLTGEDGAFRFDRLAAGKYALAASRRGYLAAAYQEHEGGYSTAIATGPDLVSTGLHLELAPPGVIDGTITDDSGNPVGGARVTLYRQQQEAGETRIRAADSDTTENDGSYEFGRLRPGTYYISVSAKPWYAFRTPLRRNPRGTPQPEDQATRSPLDVAYPMTFYANATESAAATPIQIGPGDHPELDVTLHAVPAVHLQVHLAKPQPDRGFSVPQLEQDVFGAEDSQATTLLTMRTTGDEMVVDLDGVAPGEYTLQSYGPTGVSHRAPVNLTGDTAVDLTAATNSVQVSGKVEMASGAALPPVTMLQLGPPGGSGGVSAPVSSDGSFDLPAVPPGVYTVQVVSSGGMLDIAQMAASGAELHGHRITVASDAVLLAATLSHGSVSITGFARRDSKGVGGAMILLVPEHMEDNPDLVRRDQSDSDGSFTLPRVLPGNYTLVALENGWSMDWARTEVLAPYLAHGLRLHITDEEKNLELRSAIEVQ